MKQAIAILFLTLSAAAADMTMEERENLHAAQKRVLMAQKALLEAKATLEETARHYEALQQAAREKAKQPKGCILDERLEWQCPTTNAK